MRSTIFIIAIMATYSVAAQDDASIDILPKQRKNEIGLMGEIPMGDASYGAGYEGRIGVQYKRWVKPNMAYRTYAGYADYMSQSNKNYVGRSGDTTFQSYYRNRVPVMFASGGVEMQRQFYKRVYLYAAVDLQVAYGNGKNETVAYTEVLNKNNNMDMYYADETIVSSASARLFGVAVTPFVGAKFMFNRITFGTELSGIQMDYTSLTSPTPFSSGGVSNFEIGNFRQRFFVNFRF